MKRLVTLSAFWALNCWCAPPAGFQPRPYPLPELFVTGMVDGGDGTIWLATLDGLYRFDGFAAHRVQGYPFLRAAHLLRGPDGAIWIGGNDGLVVYRGSFEVVLRDEGRLGVSRLATDGKAIYFRYDQKLWRIDSAGQRSVVMAGEIGSGASPVAGGGVVFVCADAKQICVTPSGEAKDSRPIDSSIYLGKEQLLRVAEDQHGTIWATSRNGLYRRDRGASQFVRVRTKSVTDEVFRLERLQNGEVVLLGEGLESLTGNVTLTAPATVGSLRATAATVDSSGDIWVAYRPYGLVRWRKDQDVEWKDEISSRISRGQDPYRQLFEKSWIGSDGRLVNFEHRLNGLVRISPDRLLALTVTDGVWVVDQSGRKISLCEWPNGPLVGLIMGLLDGEGRIWLGGEVGLFEVLDWPSNPKVQRVPVIGNLTVQSVQDMALDREGNVWIAHTNGLCYRKGDQWRSVKLLEPEKGVSSIAFAGASIWLTSFTPGYVARLDPNGEQWKEYRFELSGGYGSVKSVWVQVDSRGWIWRAKEDGVMVARGDRTGPLDWLELSAAKGFDLGRLRKEGFAQLPDGRVWLMGLRKSLKLKPDLSWFQQAKRGAKPVLMEFLETPHGVAAQVGGLSGNDLLEYPIQYRLSPLFEGWRGSQDGKLEFRDLRDGDYHLEVRFGGDDDANVLHHEFRVGQRLEFAWGWIAGGICGGALALWALSRTLFVRRWRHNRAKAQFLKQRNGEEPLGLPEPGMVLREKYEVVQEVALGGFSRVFEGVQVSEGVKVAIKVIAIRKEQESWLRARYAHELAALGALDHPGIVRLLDSWVGEEGELVLVMPFLEGPSLRSFLEKGPVELQQGIAILGGIAEALEEIHRVGMVHLDLKPENVILTRDQDGGLRPVLIDLGTSGFRGAEDDLTMTRMLTGSAPYMAPERLTGHYSAASDVFSLGVVGLELFTGRQTGDFAQGWYEVGFETELAALLAPKLGSRSGELAEVIIEALEPSPRRRPASAADWVEAVRRAVEMG